MDGPNAPLGEGVPLHTPHSVSVSLPMMRDVVDYEEGRSRVVTAMKSGYPRFFIKPEIKALASRILEGYGIVDEDCILFSSPTAAAKCKEFLLSRGNVSSRVVSLSIKGCTPGPSGLSELPLSATLFPKDQFSLAKQFWQHTGLGISSRYAERCLQFFNEQSTKGSDLAAAEARFGLKAARLASALDGSSNGGTPRSDFSDNADDTRSTKSLKGLGDVSRGSISPAGRQHYQKSSQTKLRSRYSRFPADSGDDSSSEEMDVDEGLTTSTYLEERFGRNLDSMLAKDAKIAMRRRLAHLTRDLPHPPVFTAYRETDPEDIYLYATGMTAIWSAHQLLLQLGNRKIGKSVCFGFPYTDTLKILEKWGPGAHFLGLGSVEEAQELRSIAQQSRDAGEPILSLFCELPSNPLLKSPPLMLLKEIADEFDFLLVVDDTVATPANVDVSGVADITVSSLTKAFSGDSNVMGGSLTLSRSSRYYDELKDILNKTYTDNLYDEDAIFLERNSRNMLARIQQENVSTEAICDYIVENKPGYTSLKSINFPKYVTKDLYDVWKRPPVANFSPGYGALFSLEFFTEQQTEAFFDALNCYKGPSLGTNFTLACPYTIIAHYAELDWVKQYNVDKNLVRVSVGLESFDVLRGWFDRAFAVADAQ